MKEQYRKKPATATTTATATAAPSHEVERTLFTLPAAVWAAVDFQRRGTGMSAAQYIASLVLTAGAK